MSTQDAFCNAVTDTGARALLTDCLVHRCAQKGTNTSNHDVRDETAALGSGSGCKRPKFARNLYCVLHHSRQSLPKRILFLNHV